MQLTRDQILAYDIATLHFRGIDFEDDDNEFDEYLSPDLKKRYNYPENSSNLFDSIDWDILILLVLLAQVKLNFFAKLNKNTLNRVGKFTLVHLQEELQQF